MSNAGRHKWLTVETQRDWPADLSVERLCKLSDVQWVSVSATDLSQCTAGLPGVIQSFLSRGKSLCGLIVCGRIPLTPVAAEWPRDCLSAISSSRRHWLSDIRPPVSAGPGGVPAHSLTVWPAQIVAFRVMPAARNSSCHSFLTQSCAFPVHSSSLLFLFLPSCHHVLVKPYTWCVYLYLLKEHWKDRRVPLTHKWSLVEFLLFSSPPPPPPPFRLVSSQIIIIIIIILIIIIVIIGNSSLCVCVGGGGGGAHHWFGGAISELCKSERPTAAAISDFAKLYTFCGGCKTPLSVCTLQAVTKLLLQLQNKSGGSSSDKASSCTMLTGQPQSLSFLFRRPQAAAKDQTQFKPPLGRAPTVVQFCCTESEPSNMPQVLQMAKNDRQLCHSCNIAFVSATENWLPLSFFLFSAAKGTLSLPAYCTGRVLQQPQNVHGSAATKYCSCSDWPVTVSRAVFVVCLFVVFVCCLFCLFVLVVCSRRKTARLCINKILQLCSLARHSEQCYFIIGGSCHKCNFCRDTHGVVATKRQNTALQRQKIMLVAAPAKDFFFIFFQQFCTALQRQNIAAASVTGPSLWAALPH